MAWKKDGEVMCEIVDGFDFILEEGQNTSTNLRKVSWNGRDPKTDIRKWSYQDGTERAMRGITLSDEGTNELASVLVEQGYGDINRIINAIKARESYDGSLDDINIAEEESYDDGSEDYYDPRELLEEAM